MENVETPIIAHDTSEFVFKGERKNMGKTSLGKSPSFFGHFSLAINPIESTPLGVVRYSQWKRDKAETPTSLRKKGLISQSEARKMPSEKDRWFEAIEDIEKLLSPEQSQKPVHVCDSETDSYALMADLINANYHFVIRGCYDRCLKDHNATCLREELFNSPILFEQKVQLSKRQKKSGSKTNKRLVSRQARTAKLAVSAKRIKLKRPNPVPSTYPASLCVNIVYLLERNISPGDTPVEWILITPLDIETPKQIKKIINIYRHRWLIEEYFKALKTGCNYEKRQLGSYETLSTCLGLFVPIAWQILYLRTQSRTCGKQNANMVLSKSQIEVLQKRVSKKVETLQEALYAVAEVGGHIKYDGPPGWLVLWRGMQELNILLEGYELAAQNNKSVKQKM